MIKYFSIILILFIPYLGKAQNLVPNHSFEETDSCDFPVFFSLVSDWFPVNLASPDLYSFCQSSYPWGDIISYDLNNHIGISSYYFVDTTASMYNYREYIGVNLKDTLVLGKSYCFSAFFALSDRSNYSISSLGIYVSTDSIFQNNNKVIEINNALKLSDTFIENKLYWVKYDINFISQGGEKFLYIGNFENDLNTNYNNLNSSTYNYAYYLIDNVSLNLCPGQEEPPPPIHHYIYPNPSNGGQFTVEVYDEEAVEVLVHNEIGQLIYYELLPEGATQKSIQLQLASGVYLVSFSRGGNRIKTEKVVVLK